MAAKDEAIVRSNSLGIALKEEGEKSKGEERALASSGIGEGRVPTGIGIG